MRIQAAHSARARVAACTALALLGMLALPPARAAVTTPFNDALMLWHSPDVVAPDFFGQSDVRSVQAGAMGPRVASNSYAGAGDWGSVEGFALADLATGTLKAAPQILSLHRRMQRCTCKAMPSLATAFAPTRLRAHLSVGKPVTVRASICI